MARKLTNLQMNILAERVTDLLEEANRQKVIELSKSKEYTDFEVTYVDDVVKELRGLDMTYANLKREIEALEARKESIKEKVREYFKKRTGNELARWNSRTPIEELKDYLADKKAEVYPDSSFNRDKTLRKVQADILLSDVDNPEELVTALVNKFKE